MKEENVGGIERDIIRYGKVPSEKVRGYGNVPRPVFDRTAYVVTLDYTPSYGKTDIWWTKEGAIARAIRESCHKTFDPKGVPIVQRNIYDDPLHHKVTRVRIIAEEEIYNTRTSKKLRVAAPRKVMKRSHG